MPFRILIILLLVFSLSCKNDKSEDPNEANEASEMVFDKAKWTLKEGKNYVFRERMLKDVVYNDTIRSLDKNQVINLLGEPDYYGDDPQYMYYRIVESGLGFFTLKTQTMVIKLKEEDGIEWIKIHE
jgi:hypothetical protein